MSRALTPYERWMVRSNLARIASGEVTAEATVALLRAGGYYYVAAAVERECS